MTVPIPTIEDFAPVDPGLRVALKQRIVAAYLQNPFRDDDAQSLSSRLGESRRQVTAALRDLCSDQLLKPAADRGFMLDAVGLGLANVSQAPAAQTEPCAGANISGSGAHGSGPGALISGTEDASAHAEEAQVISSATAEASVAFAHFQEELFNQLRSDVVEPLRVIQDFLENQEATQLGLARAALEQIYWAVQELGLSAERPAGEGLDPAGKGFDPAGKGFDPAGEDPMPGAGQ